jgi:hypothetical protein
MARGGQRARGRGSEGGPLDVFAPPLPTGPRTASLTVGGRVAACCATTEQAPPTPPLPPVLSGHVSSLSPYKLDKSRPSGLPGVRLSTPQAPPDVHGKTRGAWGSLLRPAWAPCARARPEAGLRGVPARATGEAGAPEALAPAAPLPSPRSGQPLPSRVAQERDEESVDVAIQHRWENRKTQRSAVSKKLIHLLSSKVNFVLVSPGRLSRGRTARRQNGGGRGAAPHRARPRSPRLSACPLPSCTGATPENGSSGQWLERPMAQEANGPSSQPKHLSGSRRPRAGKTKPASCAAAKVRGGAGRGAAHVVADLRTKIRRDLVAADRRDVLPLELFLSCAHAHCVVWPGGAFGGLEGSEGGQLAGAGARQQPR